MMIMKAVFMIPMNLYIGGNELEKIVTGHDSSSEPTVEKDELRGRWWRPGA